MSVSVTQQNSKTRVVVQTQDFDISALQRELNTASSNVGAVASFVGMVRANGLGADVQTLTLEHYPGMTEKSMQAIVDAACARWPLLSVIALHRVGCLSVGENIVYVGVSSAHRKAALQACEFIIDQLKTKAIFWKKENSGAAQQWLLPTQADKDIADKW